MRHRLARNLNMLSEGAIPNSDPNFRLELDTYVRNLHRRYHPL